MGDRCGECGAINRPGARYCGRCGHELWEANQSPLAEMLAADARERGLCPACRASVAPGARFCGACGARLMPGAAGRAPDPEYAPGDVHGGRRSAPRAADRSLLWIGLLVFVGVVVAGSVLLLVSRGGTGPKIVAQGRTSAGAVQTPAATLPAEATPGATSAPNPTPAPTLTLPPLALAPADPSDEMTTAAIQRAIDGLPGGTSAVVVVGDTVVARDPEREVPAASLIKLAIAAEVLHQIDVGRVPETRRITVREEDIVGGTGILHDQAGQSYTVVELVEIMLRHSDNTAGNILIDLVGGFDPVNAYSQRLGLTNTRLNRKFLDTEAQARGIENVTTAQDVAMYLVLLSEGRIVDRSASDLILRALEERGRSERRWLLTDVPASSPAAHITGLLAGVRNDAVLGTSRLGPYLAVVLAQGDDEEALERLLSEAGAAIHEVLAG